MDDTLLAMPLHAITEMYGEEGLRRRFELEVEKLPASSQSTLLDALAWAADLHADQRRVREPYLNHLLRVTIRIITYYQVSDVDVLVAALLHDAVEDQSERIVGVADMDKALKVVAERYGERVGTLVSAVTNPAYRPDRDKDLQYREHVAEALEREPWARVIKLSDFTDNGVGVIHTVGPKVKRAATKYRPLVPVFRELVSRSDTPLTDEVKAHIYSQLDLAEERFSKILD